MKTDKKYCAGCHVELTEANISLVTGVFCTNCIDLEEEAIISAGTNAVAQMQSE